MMIIRNYNKYEKCKRELVPLIKKDAYFNYPVKYENFTQNGDIPASCSLLNFRTILGILDAKTENKTTELYIKEYNTITKITIGCIITNYSETKLEKIKSNLN